MTREERLAILGADAIAQIHARVALAPPPSPELVEELRRIMTNPAGEIPAARPTDPERTDDSDSRHPTRSQPGHAPHALPS